MSAGGELSSAQRRDAEIVLPLYLRPELWLKRRTDQTVVRDIHHVTWTTTLGVALDFEGLKDAGVAAIEPSELAGGIVLPMLLKRREAATEIRITDHSGNRVGGLTWQQTRPLVETMLVGMAEEIVATDSHLGVGLDATLEQALRRYGGDIDEVAVGSQVIDDWANRLYHPASATGAQARALLRDVAMHLALREHKEGFLMMARVALRPDGTSELQIEHDAPIREETDIVDPSQRDATLRLPVGWSPSYQCEIRLPAGATFRDHPAIDAQFEGRATKQIALGSTRLLPVPRGARAAAVRHPHARARRSAAPLVAGGRGCRGPGRGGLPGGGLSRLGPGAREVRMGLAGRHLDRPRRRQRGRGRSCRDPLARGLVNGCLWLYSAHE